MKTVLKGSLLLLLTTGMILMSACSPLYIMRAAYEQSRILLRREKIETVLQNPAADIALKNKLQLVLEARDFAEKLGLNPGNSFRKYSKVDKDVLAWIVLGSKPDSFSLYTWWFPIVGTVPYKGFFSADDANRAARGLEAKGYETWVRGTDAFSTLGWFDDPVLSTILKQDDISIVNTVIHESVHSTLWIKGHVDFNESLANFIGTQGAVEFYRAKVAACGPHNAECFDTAQKFFDASVLARDRSLELSRFVNEIHRALHSLYKSDRTSEEKLAERQRIFEEKIAPVRAAYPGMTIFKSVNNAEIMQLKLYMTELDLFEKLYAGSGFSFKKMLEKLEKLNDSDSKRPFDALKALTE